MHYPTKLNIQKLGLIVLKQPIKNRHARLL